MRASFLAAALVLLAAGPARAQSPAPASDPASRAAADALFDEGRKLAADGHFAGACPKFEAAQKLRPGVGTLLNLADCFEKTGRTASAWARFREAVGAAERAGDARADLARQRAASLEPTLVKMTIVAPAGIAGLEILRGGALLDAAAWGTALPVDPGTYEIEARAPGRVTWHATVATAPEGVAVTIPPLAETTPEPAPVATPAPAPPAAPPPPAPAAATAEPPATFPQRTVGLVVGAAGVVGLGVGTVFGLLSMSAHGTVASTCTLGTEHDQCPQSGYDASHTALDDGNVATVALVVGAVALAGGAVLYLTAPTRTAKGTTTPVGLQVGPARVALVGSF